MFKLQAGDGPSVSLGQVIWIRSGTGANQLRQIIVMSGYGTDVVAVSRDWAAIPDNTTTYKILQGMLFEISPNPVTAIVRMFSNTAADGPAGTQRTYYEKVFIRQQQHWRTALAGAPGSKLPSETPSLPSGALLDLALTTVLNDTGTAAKSVKLQVLRAYARSSRTSGLRRSVPGPGSLPSGTVPPNALRRSRGVVTVDLTGRHRDLQGRGRPADSRNHHVTVSPLATKHRWSLAMMVATHLVVFYAT